MEYTFVNSFNKLESKLLDSERSFLLLYKSGSEQSECAFKNLENLEIENNDFQLNVVDVNKVRDIHEHYGITSVPTLIEFKGGKPLQIIKGCHESGFLNSIFEKSLYSAKRNLNNKKIKRVIVYSTTTCPHCTTAKNYLKNNKIAFRDVDVSKDQKMAQAMVKKSGQQGVPQIEINGRIIVGFDKNKIDELLEIK